MYTAPPGFVGIMVLFKLLYFVFALYVKSTYWNISLMFVVFTVDHFQSLPCIHLYSDLQADTLICGFIYQDDSLVPNPSTCINKYLSVLPVTLPCIVALASLLVSLTGELLHKTSR